LSKKSPDVVEIEIFDRRYPLRLNTPAEREEILRLAEQVDSRMREIAAQTHTVDSVKVAILTALHLAQEKQEKGGGNKELEDAVKKGAKKWIREIDKALD
jgi:cell division protein ZapA (FtsZ GTPase activity inhibitor)